jgi:multicomponent Na+:H+ antiporter subunit G
VTAIIAGVLVGLGTLITVLAAVAAVRAGDVYVRVHCLTVVTSVGSPLIGVGLIVVNGFGFTGASVLLVVLLQAVGGPLLGAATGRVNAQRDGVIGSGSPE